MKVLSNSMPQMKNELTLYVFIVTRCDTAPRRLKGNISLIYYDTNVDGYFNNSRQCMMASDRQRLDKKYLSA